MSLQQSTTQRVMLVTDAFQIKRYKAIDGELWSRIYGQILGGKLECKVRVGQKLTARRYGFEVPVVIKEIKHYSECYEEFGPDAICGLVVDETRNLQGFELFLP